MKNNIFELIPNDLTDEIFQTIIEKDNIKIERIVSMGHTSPESGWYDQDQNEWVIILKGEAIISFENESDLHLTPGDYTNIPAHKKHKVSWTAPDSETIWIAVFY